MCEEKCFRDLIISVIVKVMAGFMIASVLSVKQGRRLADYRGPESMNCLKEWIYMVQTTPPQTATRADIAVPMGLRIVETLPA